MSDWCGTTEENEIILARVPYLSRCCPLKNSQHHATPHRCCVGIVGWHRYLWMQESYKEYFRLDSDWSWTIEQNDTCTLTLFVHYHDSMPVTLPTEAIINTAASQRYHRCRYHCPPKFSSMHPPAKTIIDAAELRAIVWISDEWWMIKQKEK